MTDTPTIIWINSGNSQTWLAGPNRDHQSAYFSAADAVLKNDADLLALVDAAKGLLFAHDHGNGLEGWHNTREKLRLALAAWEARQ